MLIEVFLNAVYVFNDKIVISCNYKDGTKTVNFSEMESALTLRASASGSDLDCPGAPCQNKAARSCGGTNTATLIGDLVFPFQPRPADAGLCDGMGSDYNLHCPDGRLLIQ